MSEPMPVPDVEAVPVPRRAPGDERDVARDRLGATLRELVDAAVRTTASAGEIDAVRVALESAGRALAEPPPAATFQDNPFHPLSLVGGTAHPVGPQLYLDRDGDGVRGTVRLGPVFEGGPGLAHGGILALLFDHSMGAAVFLAGFAAMTRTLDVVYHAPTPLAAELTVRARVDRVDGRKVSVSAEVRHGETVTASATALFVALTRDNVAQIFHRS